MPADQLLERLDLVRANGPDRWMARCPAHEDRGPSLSVREVDGKVLVHCFGGCSALDVVEACGLTLSDLFAEPPQESPGGRSQHRLSARDALAIIKHESMFCAVFTGGILQGRRFSEAEIERCHEAVRRISIGWREKSMAREPAPAAKAESRHREALGKLDAIDGGGWPPPLDLRELAGRDPDPPSMIIDDWLPAGYATMLAGHGGSGKSYIALYLAVCIAMGLPFFGIPTTRRRVLWLSCEDREGVLHWRLARICNHLGISIADLDGQLLVLDLVGHDSVLWERTAAGGRTTGAYNLLMGALHGAEVVFFDGVADIFAGNENDRGDAKRIINVLVALIPPDRGAVVLIHHVNKPAAGTSTSEGYSGSTGWHNSVRARWYLYPEIEQTDEGADRTGRLILELQKSNLGRADQSMTFEWDDTAHLFVGQLAGGTSAVERHMRDQDELDGILAAIREIESSGDYVPAAATGNRTAFHVLSASESFPQTFKSKGDRRRFWRHIEVLRRMGTLAEGSIRRANGHKTATLTLEAAADKGCVASSNAISDTHPPFDAATPVVASSNATGGYKGGARAKCLRCDGEGCDYCEGKS